MFNNWLINLAMYRLVIFLKKIYGQYSLCVNSSQEMVASTLASPTNGVGSFYLRVGGLGCILAVDALWH
jgi:hypothetical protein